MLSYDDFKNIISGSKNKAVANNVVFDDGEAIFIDKSGRASVLSAEKLYRMYCDLSIRYPNEKPSDIADRVFEGSNIWSQRTGETPVFQNVNLRGALSQAVLKQKCSN